MTFELNCDKYFAQLILVKSFNAIAPNDIINVILTNFIDQIITDYIVEYKVRLMLHRILDNTKAIILLPTNVVTFFNKNISAKYTYSVEIYHHDCYTAKIKVLNMVRTQFIVFSWNQLLEILTNFYLRTNPDFAVNSTLKQI